MSKLTEKMMELEREQTKEVESYPRVLSLPANSPKTKQAGKDKRSISTKNAGNERKQCNMIYLRKQWNQRKHI